MRSRGGSPPRQTPRPPAGKRRTRRALALAAARAARLHLALRGEAAREDGEGVVEVVLARRLDGDGLEQVVGDLVGRELVRDDREARRAPRRERLRRAHEPEFPEHAKQRPAALVLDVGRQVPRQRLEQAVRERRARRLDHQQPVERRRVAPRVVDVLLRLGRVAAAQRRLAVGHGRRQGPARALERPDRRRREAVAAVEHAPERLAVLHGQPRRRRAQQRREQRALEQRLRAVVQEAGREVEVLLDDVGGRRVGLGRAQQAEDRRRQRREHVEERRPLLRLVPELRDADRRAVDERRDRVRRERLHEMRGHAAQHGREGLAAGPHRVLVAPTQLLDDDRRLAVLGPQRLEDGPELVEELEDRVGPAPQERRRRRRVAHDGREAVELARDDARLARRVRRRDRRQSERRRPRELLRARADGLVVRHGRDDGAQAFEDLELVLERHAVRQRVADRQSARLPQLRRALVAEPLERARGLGAVVPLGRRLGRQGRQLVQ
mmetsp:Transcript_1241/g.3976  ORF Transcript_1241/g.3976 Transcript_1241/m.3976 type:complete len:496 (+) Transcript_1241:531-2018(+)